MLAEIIADDSSLTQKGMISKLNQSNIQMAQSTVSILLKKMNITRKRLIIIADKKNDLITIEKRHPFAISYRRYQDQDLLYLDETGFNLHSTRSYGYSPVNVPARVVKKAGKGKNVTFLCLLSSREILLSKIINEPCNNNILNTIILY